MVSAMLSVVGVFLGILIVAVLVGVGFATGVYKLLKGIIRGIIGLFKRNG